MSEQLPQTVVEKKYLGNAYMTVKTESGLKLNVPTSLEASRARMQIVSTHVVELYRAQIEAYTSAKVTMKAKDIADIITAGKKLQELCDASYGAGALPAPGDSTTGLGSLVREAVAAGAEAAKGTESPEALMRKLTAMGKKVQKETAIDIVEEK